jgi:hypothetical protein
MRCVVFAAAKAQSFFLKVIVVTSRRARLKNAARNPPDNTVILCDAAKPWSVTGSSFAKNKKSNESISYLKASFEIISNARRG